MQWVKSEKIKHRPIPTSTKTKALPRASHSNNLL